MNLNNFLSVLTGEVSSGGGRVLESGENDDIFLYFVDHGSYGIVSLPSDYLDALTLQKTIASMHAKRKFKRLLIYLESCYSGSMFQDYLPQNMSVMAVTASNSTEPSFACFYDRTLNTFLADVFSYTWMRNSEQSDHKTESILDQILFVTNNTADYSHTSVFGDDAIKDMKLSSFQGGLILSEDFDELLLYNVTKVSHVQTR